jgi:hypothetical protein
MDAGVGMLGGAKTRRPAARPIFDGFLPFSCMLSITLFAGT